MDLIEQAGIIADAQHLRVRTVFGLRQQIGGHKRRACAGVGDDQDFGGTGRHVDGRTTGQSLHLLLGGRDIGIARSE